MHDQSPVPDLVAEALDQHAAVSGQNTRGGLLFGQVTAEIVLGVGVQAGALEASGCRGLLDLSQELPDRLPHLEGPALGVGVPERELAGFARRRGDHDPVERDLLDPPRGRPQTDDIADTRLVDHLLVEFAHAAVLGADDEHREQPAVGDRAPGDDRGPLCPLASGEHVRGPVPHNPWPQLGEIVGRVPPGEHVENGFIRATRQVGVSGGLGDGVVELINGPVAHRDHGDDLLAEHVQWVSRDAGGLDTAGGHAFHGDRCGQQIAAMGGEEHATADRVEAVSRASEALQTRGHRGRATHLHHQVDAAHVNAQFQAAGRHDRRQPSGFQVVLDDRPFALAHAAVMSPGDDFLGAARDAGLGHDLGGNVVLGLLVSGQFIEPARQAFTHPAGVREHDRGRVVFHQIQDRGFDCRPDRRPPWLTVLGFLERGHVRQRDPHLQVDGLAQVRRDDPNIGARMQEARHDVHRGHRGGQPDALRRRGCEFLKALQRQAQVAAALGPGDRMDLVDDDGLDVLEELSGLRGEQQEQGLRGRNEDVRRGSRHALPFGGGGVGGADRGRDWAGVLAQSACHLLDAGQRGAQVAFDIGGQGAQRRYVQHSAASRRLGDEVVKGPEEGGQRLA